MVWSGWWGWSRANPGMAAAGCDLQARFKRFFTNGGQTDSPYNTRQAITFTLLPGAGDALGEIVPGLPIVGPILDDILDLVVPRGSTVSWQCVTGIHTLTSGRGASDPDAGAGFDYLLDEQHPRFDSTFTDPDTVRYFCFFHEPRMRGVLVVTSSADVPEGPARARLAFRTPPRPNPSRSTVSLEIGVPREQKVRIEVLNLLGTRVALLHDGPLGSAAWKAKMSASSTFRIAS